MSKDLQSLTSELRALISKLLQRCTAAESRVTELEVALAGRDARIATLEQQLSDLTSKYQSLQTGMTQGSDPAQIAALKERYLVMVHEIDDCIAQLQNS